MSLNIEMIKNAVNKDFMDTKLVGYLLNKEDYLQGGYDSIEWNKFYENNSESDNDDDDTCDLESDARSTAIDLFDWYRVSNNYSDIFRYTKYPTYSFKGSTWVLKTFYSLNFYSDKWIEE